MTGLDEHYSARGIQERILDAIRAAGLNPDTCLSPEELGALDHFHTGGRRATLELLQLVQIQTHHRVLDVSAGLGGPARLSQPVAAGWSTWTGRVTTALEQNCSTSSPVSMIALRSTRAARWTCRSPNRHSMLSGCETSA